jgi:nitrite reductase/ring-hydroxylating ferredoxin subunit
LADGGVGIRFEIPAATIALPAFAVRYAGRVYAYVNRCPHAWTELDWEPGKFFDLTGFYLQCATHGAIFDPMTGRCVGGPCRGAFLEKLATREEDGQVFIVDSLESR